MARKGNPISIQVGSVRATAKVTEWVSLFLQFVPDFKSKKAWEDVADKTTERHPGLEHVVKEAHWTGVLRPCLRGTVECRYHEREVQDTRPRNPGNHSPMCQSLAHPGPRRPAQLERPSLI
ncbi:phosphotyrosine protein phosphatases superfamily protein [Striga asiatica]|uniref:Phosphotyrosine protein phosphatases superfamily protein n=1 Tax=Striga asiatica TaxID=4170 RepID=A0A5A7Q3W2_STRAF|nr:phosphotyrosine protein phosphatases superfamily protein [Striga asiatica]